MGLWATAAADAKRFLANSDHFGWPITVTDPDGSTADLTGYANDIGQSIDPQTGALVTGRAASCALHLDALSDAGLGTPRAVADEALTPWVVVFDDIQGVTHKFKVSEAMVDRTAGIVVCMLEAYKE